MMRKFLNNAAVKLTAATLCLAMLSTAVDARLLTVSFEQPRILPGVDANGNLDYFNGGDASYKVIVNTRQQRTYVNGRGKVDNLSRRNLRVEDIFMGSVFTLPEAEIASSPVVSSIYTVSSRGTALLILRTYVNN